MSRVVVAGGAGFLGSHLCDRLIERGDTVVCLDDLSTGSRENVAHLLGHDRFSLDRHQRQREGRSCRTASTVDAVCNLASPASPPAYLARPFDTLAVGSEGTRRLLELAREHEARFLMASTSEIYGDPEVHPQVESYRGNVDPTGPRSVYDEAKRFSESLTMAMHRTHGVNVGIVRIFNTYGPRLVRRRRPRRVQLHRAGAAGRAVDRLRRRQPDPEPVLRRGRDQRACSPCSTRRSSGPVNIGNPDERTMLELAHFVLEVTGSASDIVFEPLPTDDPTRRCPDITLARRELGWEPRIGLREGIERTIEYFADRV